MSEKYQLAVNGTLMRGLELNKNLLEVGAEFVRETRTAEEYRVWSIDDKYPGMLRVRPPVKGTSITVEIWELDGAGLVSVLAGEPPGLTIGQVILQDGTSTFGVLAEPWIVEGKREITEFGGWREYITSE
jgi:hypothetical protein